MNFTFFHELHLFPCIRARKGISDRIWRISCSFSWVWRVSHVFVHFLWISRFFPWTSRCFSWIARSFHEFQVFFMNFRFFSWISRFFLWIACFFHEFHGFFMNSTFFSSVSRVSHVFVHAQGFEPRTKENIGNLVLAHIFGRCIPILQPKLVKKEVFKYIFAKMYTNTAKQKDCGMDPPPTPPLGTWMERLQALKVLSDIC